jgi:hypothetical protein
VGTPVVTLNGTVLGGSSTYSWALRWGSAPNEELWTLTDDRAAALPLCQPLTFEVQADGGRKDLKVEQLYVLEVLPGPTPMQRTARVADRRWLWGRPIVDSRFNVLRATGESTLRSEASAPVELAQIEPDVRYAKWSLDGESIAWTPRRILEWLFSEVLLTPLRIEGDLPQIEVQDLDLNGSGSDALDQVLGFLPGAEVFIDYDGTAVVRNVLALPAPSGLTQVRGQPVQVLPGLNRRHTFGGDMTRADRRALRPSAVEVYFQPEVECRFDGGENVTTARDRPELRNVAPTPDLTTTLSTGEIVARGSYVPLSDLFTIWGSFGVRSEPLSFSVLCSLGFSASLLEVLWSGTAGSLLADPVSVARARAATQHWRRTYQIDERFLQRISGIKATRVAILNPRTGLRAKSQVFCAYTRRPNIKNPMAKGQIENPEFGWAVDGWAAAIADAKPAPATVTVQDEGAGIIRFEPQLDPQGITDAIMFGESASGLLPTHEGDAAANRNGNDALAQWQAMKMVSTFKIATVLTVTPASPNNLGRLWKVTIPAAAVGHDGTGPVVQVRASFPTARFAWSDTQGEETIQAILRGTPPPAGQLVNAGQLDAVAKAMARAVYTNLSDQPLTSAPVSVDMDPDVKPVGALGDVRHGLQNGRTTTVVTATGIRRPVSLWPFLDASTRRVLRGIFMGGS